MSINMQIGRTYTLVDEWGGSGLCVAVALGPRLVVLAPVLEEKKIELVGTLPPLPPSLVPGGGG